MKQREEREKDESALEGVTGGGGEGGEQAPCLLVPPKLKGFMSDNYHPHS